MDNDENPTGVSGSGEENPTLGNGWRTRRDSSQAPESSSELSFHLSSAIHPTLEGYEVIEELGRGGMGVVYKARDTRLKRLVALKMIRSGDRAEKKELVRFQAEAEVLARLQHPGIVQVYEVGHHEGAPYFALEFVSGGSLTEFTDRKPMDPVFAAKIVEAVAVAVQFAHDRGIAHRDLKPDNILLSRRQPRAAGAPPGSSSFGSDAREIPFHDTTSSKPAEHLVPKVADFGLAKQLDIDEGQTKTGAILGTPTYMAPEQADGDTHSVGAASDIFALGGVLYYLLTGRPPFQGATPLKTILMVRNQDPVAPTQLQPGLSSDLETICLKCLEKDPQKRFLSARELCEELGRFLRGEPIRSLPITPTVRLWRWCLRNPLVASLSLAVCLLLVAVFITSIGIAVWMGEVADQEALARAKAESQLIQFHTANGLRMVDQANLPGALPWLAEAVSLDQARAAKHEDLQPNPIYRRRLGSVLAQCPRFTQTWFHDNYVHHVAFSPDGKQIVSACKDGVARVWDVATGSPITPPLMHEGEVLFATYSDDGKYVVTTSSDRMARLWLVSAGRISGKTMPHDGTVTWADVSPDGETVATASDDATVRLWKRSDGEPLCSPLVHDGPVRTVEISPDGRRVLSASADHTARLWALESGLEICRMDHAGSVRYATFSSDGRFIATASRDRTGRVWDSAGKPVTRPLGHDRVLTHIAFNRAATQVVTASEDNTARIWDIETSQPLAQPLKHDDYVNRARFSRDGRFVLTAGSDLKAAVWDARTGELAAPVFRHGDGVTRVSFAPDGRRLLTVALRRVTVWDLASSEPNLAPLRHQGYVSDGEFSADGARIVTASSDRTARIWDSATGYPLTPPLHHRFPVSTVDFSPDSSLVFTASSSDDADQGGELCVWEAATGQLKRAEKFEEPIVRVQGTPDGTFLAIATTTRVIGLSTRDWSRSLLHQQATELFSFALSPDASLFATGGLETEAFIWDRHSGNKIHGPLKHPGRVDYLDFSRDGMLLLSASSGEGEPSIAQLWDSRSGARVSFNQQEDSWYMLHSTFSSDSNSIVSSGGQYSVIWNALSGDRVVPPLSHQGMIEYSCFSRDNRLVATASWDRTGRVWDAETGQPITPSLGHDDWLTRVQFSPNGDQVLTMSRDRTARVRDIRPATERVDELKQFAELLAYHRTNLAGVTAKLQSADVQQLWSALGKSKSDLPKVSRPQIVSWHWRHSQQAADEQNWTGVIHHANQALSLEPECWPLWLARAEANAELARWEQADGDYHRAGQLKAKIGAETWCKILLIKLVASGPDACQTPCDELQKMVSGLPGRVQEQVVRAWTTGSMAISGPIAAAADQLFEHQSDDESYIDCKAAVLLRTGQFQQSLDLFEAVASRGATGAHNAPFTRLRRALLGEIAHLKLQHPNGGARIAALRARFAAEQSEPWWSELLWPKRLELQLLLEEAIQCGEGLSD